MFHLLDFPSQRQPAPLFSKRGKVIVHGTTQAKRKFVIENQVTTMGRDQELDTHRLVSMSP